MKKLRLNKLFHWLYAFLMLYPVFLFFGFIIVCAFNPSFTLDNGSNITFYEAVNGTLCSNLLLPDWFASGSIGYDICNSIFGIVTYFGFDVGDVTEIGTVIGGLFVHWIVVSVFYLIFDVLMYPINLFHRWIDEGGV